jgi:hypothetical protein
LTINIVQENRRFNTTKAYLIRPDSNKLKTDQSSFNGNSVFVLVGHSANHPIYIHASLVVDINAQKWRERMAQIYQILDTMIKL